MADFQIEGQSRTVIGKKVKTIRNEGFVPAVIYGPRTEPVNIQLPYRPLERTLGKAGGTSLIDISIDGKNFQVLALDVQRDILRQTIKHVDFLAIDESSKIVIDVPLTLVGESAAVTGRRGLMLVGPTSIKVEMTASSMINSIEIDLANYPNVGDSLYVRELNLGENRRPLNNPDEMILRIVQSSAARRAEGVAKAVATPAPGKK
ncbi:MAG: 50S ribosomal protein L25 [Phototrophicaceae bacterium]|jgi:large subunit ribosomal protein L25